MKNARRIAKNTFILVLSNIVNLILSFFYAAYAARYLGPEGYGSIAYAIALTGIFGSLMDMGLSQLAIRDVSRDAYLIDKYAFNMAALKLFLVPLAIIIVAITANIIGKGDRTSISVVYIMAVSAGVASFSSIFTSAFQSMEKMEYSAISTFLNGLCMLIGAMVAIRLGLNVLGFACIYLVANAIVFLYSLTVYATKFYKARASPDILSWGSMFYGALPFGLAGLFYGIYSWISSVILSFTMGNEAVGWYNAAFRLIIILSIVPSVVNTSLFPVMSRFYMTSKTMLMFVQRRSFRYMAILGLPIGVGTTLIAERIILLIFGLAYINSVIVLQILIWSSVLVFISSSFYRLLSASNLQSTVTKLLATCASVTVVLDLVLIPTYSYVGASLANVVSEVVSLILSMYACHKIGYSLSRDDMVFLIKIAIASIIMGIFLLFMRDLIANLILLILSSAIVYFAAALLLHIFDKEDLEIFKNVLDKGT